MLTYIRQKKVIIGILITIALAVYFIKFRHSAAISEDGEVTVEATEVKQSTMPLEAHALGTLSARSVDIIAKNSGQVKNIYFKDGMQVKEGERLLQLEGVVLEEKYASSKADYQYISGNYQRMLPLSKRGYIAKDALEKAATEVKRKKAEMEENLALLQHALLIAPFSGVAGKCKVNIGSYVSAGESIVTLTDTAHLRVEYNLPEKYFPQIRIGQEVKISSAAYPEKSFAGTVSFISPTIDVSNRTINLYADIPNDDNQLVAGMLVNVVQILGGEEPVVVIPTRSLMPILDGQQVFKIVDGKATSVNVLVGNRTENEVQIIQGLAPGDNVITDGQLKVRNSMPVKVKSP